MRSFVVILAVLGATLASDASLANDQPSSAAAAPAKPWFVDPRRLPDDKAAREGGPETQPAAALEAARKNEEQKRLLDETAARLKAEEERLMAREAQAREQAAELKRLADEAKRKAEEQARTEAEAAAKAAVESSPQAEPAPARANIPAFAVDCPSPTVSTESTSGGRAKVVVQSSCRADQAVELRYGPYAMKRKLDSAGHAELMVDLFLEPDAEAGISFADGERQPLKFEPTDLSAMTKIALIWTAPINLDLHAFEYAATANDPGHVSASAPRDSTAAATLVARDGRAHGFMSSVDDGQHDGDKIEVITLLRSKTQTSGVIAMALDYETRGDKPSGETCGDGRYAEPAIEIVVRDSNGEITRETGVIGKVPCGSAIPASGRFLRGIVPDVRLRP